MPNTKWKDSLPGSTDYHPDKNVFLKKNPGYSMSLSLRDNKNFNRIIKDNYPGVGKYNVRGEIELKANTFSKGDRMPFQHTFRAGPGFYKIPCSIVDINDYTRYQKNSNFDIRYKYV